MKVLYVARRSLVFMILVFVFTIRFSNAHGQEPTDSEASHRPTTSQWPTIRGPMLDGHSLENGIAENWPPEGPPVLWTRELGQGYSAFIAWKDCVATQTQNLGGQYVVCMFADSGKTKWQYRYDWPYDPAGVYPGPRSTPTYDDGFVYFTSPSGMIGCLNAELGNLVWSVELEETFRVKVPGFGYACSPIVLGEKIILPVGARDASLVALDKRNGSIKWRAVSPPSINHSSKSQTSESQASYCSVYPISFQGRPCVVCYLQNALVCHDSETGVFLWQTNLSSGYDEHSAWPIYQEPYLWISGAFQRGSELLEITGDTGQPIRTVRQSKLMSNDIFSSVLYDGALFGFDLHEAQAKTHRTSRGIFRCIDFRTGQELWSVGNGRMQRNTGNGSGDTGFPSSSESLDNIVGHATVLIAEGKLILMNDLGELILARASRERYEELSRTALLGGEICWTQPAISRLRLFVRNHSRAVCVYLGEPESLALHLKEKSISASKIPQSKYRDIASVVLGIEPEYLFDLPSTEWLWRWYWVSLVGIFGGMGILALIINLVLSMAKPATVAMNHTVPVFWVLSYAGGALGTTFLSSWMEEFFFTWHICLYVAWQVAISNMSERSTKRSVKQRVQSAAAAIFLLLTCSIYFLLCRRLSLVFEWVFLCGFLAALPFNLAAKHMWPNNRWRIVWQAVLTAFGFSAFYWSSAAILILRH